MCPSFEDIPAVIYSGLWVLKVFKKLDKVFPKPIKIIILLTDSPPAFSIKVEGGNFEMEFLDNINNEMDLERVECDSYLVLPSYLLYQGPNGIKNGLATKEVKIKDFTVLSVFAKLVGS